MNDNLLSPYLLLNNDPLTLNIDILSTNEAFAIIRSCNTGRTQLLAKRWLLLLTRNKFSSNHILLKWISTQFEILPSSSIPYLANFPSLELTRLIIEKASTLGFIESKYIVTS